MDYELAKELQQKLSVCNPEMEPMDMRNGRWIPRDTNNNPIGLEELIEACGDGFSNLFQLQHDLWEVNAFQVGDRGLKIYAKGSTPTEAVALLYLALNKK